MRFDRALTREFKRIAKEEGRTESEVVRDVVNRGLREYRIEEAMERYQRGELSQGAAAELARVSIGELHTELARRGLALKMNHERLEQELDGI